eukprot:scaffold87_cov388-Prasinococcus_capsulatus_cf.AAC.8
MSDKCARVRLPPGACRPLALAGSRTTTTNLSVRTMLPGEAAAAVAVAVAVAGTVHEACGSGARRRGRRGRAERGGRRA